MTNNIQIDLDLKDETLCSTDNKQFGDRKWLEVTIKRVNPYSSTNTTKLSDVLKFLPHGFVYKQETGMGATSLEITSHRNSIIVEPIKITASSKANSNNAFYVGSATRYHTGKTTNPKAFKEYIYNKSIPYKKIIVVAHSLPKVIATIGKKRLNQDQ